MATIQLPTDFKEFLQCLNTHEVEYLLVGGYAVGFHGYPRSTGDMDIWVATTVRNARKTLKALVDFGFGGTNVTQAMFQKPNYVVRMGVPPLRIEVLTSISGVTFSKCYRQRVEVEMDGVMVKIINLEDLRTNKRASGRLKDLNDLQNL